METIAAAPDGYYVCLEEQISCGEDGYALGFGGRYVSLYFEQTVPKMSAEGAAWLAQVGVCLQEALADGLDRRSTCEEIRATGFGAHAGCYLGTGFCALSLEDQLQVLGAITPEDRARPEVQAQLEAVFAGCSG